MARSVFSVEYDHPDHPDNYCSADWDRGRWTLYWKNRIGVSWHKEDRDDGRLSKLAYRALIKKFGLEDFMAELPVERIETMSPAELMKFRGEKGLPTLVVTSDTAGDTQARAEEYVS